MKDGLGRENEREEGEMKERMQRGWENGKRESKACERQRQKRKVER